MKLPASQMTMASNRSLRLFSILGLCFACFFAAAGDFVVNPVRLDMANNAKSASVSVSNDGIDKLSFQLQAMDWTQDKDGKDIYTESRDLIFFPKLMTIEPGQEALIRIGFRGPTTNLEKTYRLFIEELPGVVKKADNNGAQINFLVRFGLPIFTAPVSPQDVLNIEAVELKSGVLSFVAQNSGNRHQMFKSIRIEGTNAANKSVFALDIADRYLLAASTKPYQTTLSAQQCRQLSSVSIDIKTDKLTQLRKFDVRPEMCS